MLRERERERLSTNATILEKLAFWRDWNGLTVPWNELYIIGNSLKYCASDSRMASPSAPSNSL